MAKAAESIPGSSFSGDGGGAYDAEDADDGRSTSEPPDDSELSSNPAGSSVGGGGAASAAPLLAKSRSQSARALCSASVPAWITLS
jgi:hypothetical protein